MRDRLFRSTLVQAVDTLEGTISELEKSVTHRREQVGVVRDKDLEKYMAMQTELTARLEKAEKGGSIQDQEFGTSSRVNCLESSRKTPMRFQYSGYSTLC